MLTLETLTRLAAVTDPDKSRRRYFTAASGAVCYVLDPEGSDIRLEDIITGLSRCARWGGHIHWRFDHPYSVAQHSVLVSELAEAEARRQELPEFDVLQHALEALFHDAAEAYLGDVTGPLKGVLSNYREIERTWAHAIGRRVGLGYRLAQLSDITKRADLTMLLVEHKTLRIEDAEGPQWCADFEVPREFVSLRPWPAVRAASEFGQRNRDLRSRIYAAVERA
jgi:5'-deoxynucleotidase YfbR-like HD superfamily hydrolase